MGKIAFWNRYTEFARNRMFDESSYGIGEDLGKPIIELKDRIESMGYCVETLDMGNPEEYDKVLFLDYPDEGSRCCPLESIPYEKRYLILTECEMIYERNADKNLLEQFNKVFTYDDDLVRECGYIKLPIPNVIKQPIISDIKNKKFITLIAGNKTSDKEGELYSKRLSFIRYMEKNHPQEFDFYGTGWFWTTFSGIFHILNHFGFLRRMFAEKHPCYRGRVDKKLTVQSQYKFVLAYENTSAIPGYITEKLWDVFFSGAVPIYIGAPNITDYVPENCFIDGRQFESDDELYRFLKGIDDERYNRYLSDIKAMLDSKAAEFFSSKHFCDTVIREML